MAKVAFRLSFHHKFSFLSSLLQLGLANYWFSLLPCPPRRCGFPEQILSTRLPHSTEIHEDSTAVTCTEFWFGAGLFYLLLSFPLNLWSPSSCFGGLFSLRVFIHSNSWNSHSLVIDWVAGLCPLGRVSWVSRAASTVSTQRPTGHPAPIWHGPSALRL